MYAPFTPIHLNGQLPGKLAKLSRKHCSRLSPTLIIHNLYCGRLRYREASIWALSSVRVIVEMVLALSPSSIAQTLPDDVVYGIFSQMTALDVAIAQQTCRQWHSVAQQHSRLWIDTKSFFDMHYPIQVRQSPEHDYEKGVVGCIENFCKGFKALFRLSKAQMNYVLINFKMFELKDLKSSKYLWLQEELQSTFAKISKAKITTLSIYHPLSPAKGTLEAIIQNTLDFASVKQLKCTSGIYMPGNLSHLSIQTSPMIACRLESLEIDGIVFEWWHANEAIFTMFENLKHFKLSTDGHIPDSNTIFGFLHKVRLTLTILELVEDGCDSALSTFIGKLPLLHQEEVILPELTHLRILGVNYRDWEDDLDDVWDEPDRMEEDVERMIHNLSIKHVLVCPKLECLMMESVSSGFSIVSSKSLENVASLKVVSFTSEMIDNCLENIQTLEELIFEVRSVDEFESIYEYFSSSSDRSFKIEVKISLCEDCCGERLERIVRDLKHNTVGDEGEEEAEKDIYCEFNFTLTSGQSFKKSVSLAEFLEIHEALMQST